jgi:hypothetical protein
MIFVLSAASASRAGQGARIGIPGTYAEAEGHAGVVTQTS